MKGERNAKEKRSNGIDLCTAGFGECWICCVCGIFEKSGQGGHFVRRCRGFGFPAADFSAAARFFDFFTENEEKSPCADLGVRSRRRLHPWLQIVLSAFIIQFITIAAIYAADMNLNGYSGTVIQAYARLLITGKGSPVCAPDALSGLGLLSALGEVCISACNCCGYRGLQGCCAARHSDGGACFRTEHDFSVCSRCNAV